MNLNEEFNVASSGQKIFTPSKRNLSDLDWRGNITPSILPVYRSQEYEPQAPPRPRLESREETFELLMADPVYYARFVAKVEENNKRERLHRMELEKAKEQAQNDLVRKRLERANVEAKRDSELRRERTTSSWNLNSFSMGKNEDDNSVYSQGSQKLTDIIGKTKRESKGFNPLDYSSRKSSHVDPKEHVRHLSDISDSDDEIVLVP